MAEFGRIDVLVNNTAHQTATRWPSRAASAMFWLCKKAIPTWSRTPHPSGPPSPSPELLDYATTKGAIVNFTKGLGQMLAE